MIYEIRWKQVMLDSDLAKLYGILTGNLNKAVKRNIKRFPESFMFQLNDDEYKSLIFQIGISNKR
ncbi:MAG: ORF6N domain-containing protein [Bacilli bacterium]|nr:ORF6N domain-containing protein [Bacilli bacterium]